MTTFTDEKYIDLIRDAVWSGREFGRAAVMVGAGFSRNADRVRVSAPPFPLWADLTRELVERLYPLQKGTDDHKLQLAKASETSRALRLAEEFEAAFGRQRLEELLLDSIADADYAPGRLHQLLLQLPWSDVFTTNYDTLLERAAVQLAATQLVERRYDVILRPDDIPVGMRPRIIKLHGSFPSYRPFIITEEDYRTYPARFASFVNSAQQSIMENVFCLLGFSGDDPNFLYWTGWARDHLKTAAPPIYLCGVLNLSDSQRRLLNRRNVTPIDLGPLFPTKRYPDPAQRHRAAIEWFLLSLERGRPPDPLRWPLSGPLPTSASADLFGAAAPLEPKGRQLKPEKLSP